MHIKNIVMIHLVILLHKIAGKAKFNIRLLRASNRILSISVNSRNRRLYITDGLLNTIHINGNIYNLSDYDSLNNIYAELNDLIS